jgi:endo-1,4-beta-mannosidase
MYFLNSKGIADHCKVPLQAWIEEMAAYVKALDSKHLVTVGTEGFYGPGRTERLDVNPGDWAASLCSDFIQNSAVKHIDFASVHAYPDIWSVLFNFSQDVNVMGHCTMLLMTFIFPGYLRQAWEKK